jgi:hypothetical protein
VGGKESLVHTVCACANKHQFCGWDHFHKNLHLGDNKRPQGGRLTGITSGVTEAIFSKAISMQSQLRYTSESREGGGVQIIQRNTEVYKILSFEQIFSACVHTCVPGSLFHLKQEKSAWGRGYPRGPGPPKVNNKRGPGADAALP